MAIRIGRYLPQGDYLTYAAITTPTQISGLVLWLDANDTSTLFQDTGRTTPVTTNGQAVKGWSDKSGSNFHATNATGGTYASAARNGKAVTFSQASSQTLVTNCVPATGTGGRTIFIMISDYTDVGDAYDHIFHYGSTASNMAYGLTTQGGASKNATGHYWVGNFNFGVSLGTGTSELLSVRYTGSVDTLQRNGITAPNTNTIALGTNNGQGITLASRINGYIEGSGFSCYEVLAYNRSLTDSERDRVTEYLRSKWNAY